ncbi:MAG: hypothetical protein ACRDF4_07620 [Rhabdochlamydiaceae bacterium]
MIVQIDPSEYKYACRHIGCEKKFRSSSNQNMHEGRTKHKHSSEDQNKCAGCVLHPPQNSTIPISNLLISKEKKKPKEIKLKKIINGEEIY